MKAIQIGTNREFALTKSETKRLPKRGLGTVAIKVDGKNVDAIVTSNRAWSKDPDHVLEYLWFEVQGTAYYVTTDYAETAASFKGTELKTADGTGPKPKARITVEVAKEANRIALFKATWEARHAN